MLFRKGSRSREESESQFGIAGPVLFIERDRED